MQNIYLFYCIIFVPRCQTLVRHFRKTMDQTEIKKRLKSLSEDLNRVEDIARQRLKLCIESQEECENLIRDMYIKDYSPVNTSMTSGFTSGAKDRLMLYEEFVYGFDRYLKETIDDYNSSITRKNEAYRLLTYIMSLSSVCTKIMYLTYVLNKTMDEVCKSMFMSRSTYFRYHRAALVQLEKKYNETGDDSTGGGDHDKTDNDHAANNDII